MAVTSCYHRTTIIKRPLFCNILTSLDMWPLSVGITTSINFQMTLALAKLEPCGLCSRKFTGSHEGNKMDVIGSFDHSFIIESRRERLHATHNLSKQSGPPTKSCWNLLREFRKLLALSGTKVSNIDTSTPKTGISMFCVIKWNDLLGRLLNLKVACFACVLTEKIFTTLLSYL